MPIFGPPRTGTRPERREAIQKQTMRITNASHDFIIDDISRRERLEYDPSRVLEENESDSDSDDDEEEYNWTKNISK